MAHPAGESDAIRLIPNAFGERADLKLIFGALIRDAERVVRKGLDQEYDATVGLNVKPSKDEAHVKLSRNYGVARKEFPSH
jgi:hypothetical protein